MRMLPDEKPQRVPPRRGTWRHVPKWPLLAALLAALLLSVSGCVSPVDNPQGFVLSILGFIALCFVVSIVGAVLLMRYLLGKFGGTGTIKNGVPGNALIESIADTGVTMTMPSVGPQAPVYRVGLRVTPAGSGAPYSVEIKEAIPRLYIPMILPGKTVGVLIDPTDPMKVSLDFSRIFS